MAQNFVSVVVTVHQHSSIPPAQLGTFSHGSCATPVCSGSGHSSSYPGMLTPWCRQPSNSKGMVGESTTGLSSSKFQCPPTTGLHQPYSPWPDNNCLRQLEEHVPVLLLLATCLPPMSIWGLDTALALPQPSDQATPCLIRPFNSAPWISRSQNTRSCHYSASCNCQHICSMCF